MADVMDLAYQLVVRNGIKNQFCKRNENTWRKWLKNFKKFHVQPLKVFTHKRESGFTPESVAQFFFIYESAM